MTQVTGIPYRRHGPSAALRQFLDHLDHGDYFDCGRARLHGLDDALLDEARQRGLDVGDDAFVLVATDTGLIFCRPSISYAITARWDQITVTRPRGGDAVVLPVRWPELGELKFTVSKRLAGNIFRRWLQLRAEADRQTRENVVIRPPRPRDPEGEPVRAVSSTFGDDTDAEVTGDPAMGDLVSAALVGERDRLLDDGQLRRVPKPSGAASPPSWVGSAVSIAATLVVLSTVVVLISLSVGLYRRVVGGGDGPGGAVAAGAIETTIDHQRYRPATDAEATLDLDVTTPTALPASGAGGASQVDSTSNQQLLAVPGDGAGADPLSPLASTGIQRCNSNYSGCVPDLSDLERGDLGDEVALDVDCVGQGDGPWFVDGEVLVLGEDVYGLDPDGDGFACEAGGEDAKPVDGNDQPVDGNAQPDAGNAQPADDDSVFSRADP